MSEQYVISCINGLKPSESVLEYSVWLSEVTQTQLKLFYAINQLFHKDRADLSGSIGLGAKEELLNELVQLEHEENKLLHKKAKLILENATSHAQALGVSDMEVCLRKGKFVENLIEMKDRIHVCCIGKYGEKHQDLPKESVVGHKVELLIRQLEKPILIVSEKFKKPQTLCVAYDGSAGAKKVISFLADSAITPHLKVTLVYLGEPSTETTLKLEEAKSILSSVAPHVDSKILGGEMEGALKKFLSESSIDMLAMGGFGHHWIRDLLMGSFTSKVIREVQKPLLIVR